MLKIALIIFKGQTFWLSLSWTLQNSSYKLSHLPATGHELLPFSRKRGSIIVLLLLNILYVDNKSVYQHLSLEGSNMPLQETHMPPSQQPTAIQTFWVKNFQFCVLSTSLTNKLTLPWTSRKRKKILEVHLLRDHKARSSAEKVITEPWFCQ